MSLDAFQKFRAKATQDPVLSDACRKAMDGGAGNVTALINLGKRHGFSFTFEDVEQAMDKSDLSDLELELVAAGGGKSGCTVPSCTPEGI